jgi:hypothetical protein
MLLTNQKIINYENLYKNEETTPYFWVQRYSKC